MERSELEIIKELMAELEDKMQPSEADFDERLGRKKPGVEVLKIEGEMPEENSGMMMGEKADMAEEKLGGGSDEDDEDMPMDEVDPDVKLRSRLMRLRS